MDSTYPGHRPLAEGECGYLLGGEKPGICRKPLGHFFPPPEGDNSPCESDEGGLPSQRKMPEEWVLPGLPEDGGTEQLAVVTPDGVHEAQLHTVRLGLSPYILMTMEAVDGDGDPVFHIEIGGGMDERAAQDVIRSLAASIEAEGGDDGQPDPGGAGTELPGAARTDLGASG